MSQDNKIRLEMAYLQGKQSMICQVKYFDMWFWDGREDGLGV
uniref:Uncharacterized protein n=1 Tax=Siphoviridae sp. ctDiR9 TaxID=2825388 RepID=A0A8S5PRR9_9CAUD|nr:MAG TPA: hypothetical protein [Siphoviridae sp. ctDiR9]